MRNHEDFGFWLAVKRAWFSTWHSFGTTAAKVGTGIVSFAVGEVIFFHGHGMPATLLDGADNAIHVLAPAVVLWCLLFVWHFWVAPFSVVYEALKQAPNIAATAVPAVPASSQPPISFNALRLQTKWDTLDLAGILSAVDPAVKNYASGLYAYKSTIIDAMNAGKLPYFKVPNPRIQGGFSWPSDNTKMQKTDAIKWAEDNGFDMSKLK